MFDPDLIPAGMLRRIRREEYERMVSIGLFAGERVELIHGAILAMSPHDPRHASPVMTLTQLLVLALAGRALVRVQLPLIAHDDSEPEPDLAVVPIADYSAAHPDAATLVIEVSDSSLRKDRFVKGPLYAASGFREYWLLDVSSRSVEIYRGPSSEGWSSITRHGMAETISPEAFPDVKIEVASILR